MSFSISRYDLDDPDVLGAKLFDLAGIVFRKHFYASINEKNDLISVGVLKALSLIHGGNWREDKGTILNYLYSGMRNEMHNYLYHQNKQIICEEIIKGSACDVYFEKEELRIRYEVIREVCCKFNFFSENIMEMVVQELGLRGFRVVGYVKNSVKHENSYSDYVMDFLDRICGAILWKSREYSV